MYAFKIERPTSVKQAVALLANEDASCSPAAIR